MFFFFLLLCKFTFFSFCLLRNYMLNYTYLSATGIVPKLGTRPGTSFLAVCNPTLREKKGSRYT